MNTDNDYTSVKERVWYEADKDFYRSITKEELLKGINEDIDNFVGSNYEFHKFVDYAILFTH